MSSKKILRWARETDGGSAPANFLLLILACHADGDGVVSPGPSWATLRRESGLGRSTVHEAIRRLEDRGLIVRVSQERENGSHTSCDYALAVGSTRPGAGPVQEPDGYRSRSRTGTSPGAGPVQELDRSTRPGAGRVSTSENSQTRPGAGPPRPGAGPLEEKILTTSSQSRARDVHTYARASTDQDHPGAGKAGDRPTPEQLAQSGVCAEAYSLVARWRAGHDPRYRTGTYMAIGKEVDAILRDGGDPDALVRALAAWDSRPDAKPGLLPYLYDDELHTGRAGHSQPLINPDGTAAVPVEQIPDDDLTHAVLEDILGPDHNRPLGPREIEEGDPAVRAAWYRDAGAQRLAERRDEARQMLAKWQRRKGSA
jgi:Bacterial regulatory proteins, gntR family